jgi:hypothetical protein
MLVRPMRRPFLAAVTIALASCAHDTFVRGPGVTTYYDRNHDGSVDFEFHDLGGGDMDWALADRDYDGFYDIRLRYGIVLGIDRVHIPVPKGVKITKGRIPVLITDYGQSVPIGQ